MKMIYIAAPIIGITEEQRAEIGLVEQSAMIQFADDEESLADTYCPWRLKIPNAWNMPQNEWARCVFTQDVLALDKADCVVVCDYGRHSSCGTAWEAGYAFAKGKKVIVVIMPGVEETSLMVHNGCTMTIPYQDFLYTDWEFPNYRNVKNAITQN